MMGVGERNDRQVVNQCATEMVLQKSCQYEGKGLYKAVNFAKKRSEHEDHLPIMSLRRGKHGNRQRLSENRNHSLVLFPVAGHAVHHVAAIEGRPVPGVSGLPRGERPDDEKKRMERV
jgi:hypothetical protein